MEHRWHTSDRWRTGGTQVTHKWHRWHMWHTSDIDDTQVTHRWHHGHMTPCLHMHTPHFTPRTEQLGTHKPVQPICLHLPTFASSVFPHPGGPTRSTPGEEPNPRLSNCLAYRTGACTHQEEGNTVRPSTATACLTKPSLLRYNSHISVQYSRLLILIAFWSQSCWVKYWIGGCQHHWQPV